MFFAILTTQVLQKSSTVTRGGPEKVIGNITKRQRKDGSTAYRAEVRIKKYGAVAFNKSATFSHLKNAKAWIADMEREAAAPPAPKHTQTIGQLIDDYIREVDPIKPISRTRKMCMRALAKHPIANTVATETTTETLKDYCIARHAEGAGPGTTIIDIGTLAAVYRYAKAAWSLPLNTEVFAEARHLLSKLGLIGRCRPRKRRPNDTEMDRLIAWFRMRMQHASTLIPMADIVEFAAYTAMRQGEITRIRWADIDQDKRTIVIRDRKDPKSKDGNDHEIPLLGPAWEIIQRQPRLQATIFPYEARSISAAFTRSCKQLGIDNLRFHDLRREGASRLLEMGFSVPEVASVTGHKNFNTLCNHYTKIKPETLHDKYRGTSKN